MGKLHVPREFGSRTRATIACVAVPPALAGALYKAFWMSPGIPSDMLLSGIHPSPPGFAEHLRRMPERVVSPEERATLQRDGVVFLPDVLEDSLARHVVSGASHLWVDWKCNGVLRALVRDGPFGALAASALNVSKVSIFATNAFRQQGGHPEGHYARAPFGGVHVDIDSSPGYILPMVSVWWALTDAPHALELLNGSHVANLELDCPYGSILWFDDPCIVKLINACNATFRWFNARAGDAIVFYSQTYHWAVIQRDPRAAISLKFVAASSPYDFFETSAQSRISRQPWWCYPIQSSTLYPAVYPRDEADDMDKDWPMFDRRIDGFLGQYPDIWVTPWGPTGLEMCPRAQPYDYKL